MTDHEAREGGFLRNWSRRKLAAKRDTPVAAELPVAPAEVPEPIQPDDPIDTQALIDALPSIDEITAGFDIKPFLAKGVPVHLKNAALRKLWLVSPAVRDYVDPAVDYAWDWNAPGGVPGGGGVLSSTSVEKMVKDLIGTRPDPESEETTTVTAEASAPPNQSVQLVTPEESVKPSQPEAPLPHDPADDAVRADPTTVPADANGPRPRQERTALVSQRRHGGAIPE
jgi:hypothetical protein